MDATGVKTLRVSWIPAAVLAVGCAANFLISSQRTMELQAPLTALPSEIDGHRSTDLEIPEAERRVAGTTTSILRSYRSEGSEFQVYVGFYASQKQGKTIHSPKNCLPGAGWEPLESRREVLPSGSGAEIRVNRFLIANKNQQALVYYWYQGRGRTESSEYKVKFDLMRDSAIKRRSDEALVRLVIPLRGDNSKADELARRMVGRIHDDLKAILPS